MKKQKGSIVDYAIPTLIVGAVFGLALYNIVSDGSLIKNIEASLFGTKRGDKLIINPTGSSMTEVTPGSLGGTPNNPKMHPLCKCKVTSFKTTIPLL